MIVVDECFSCFLLKAPICGFRMAPHLTEQGCEMINWPIHWERILGSSFCLTPCIYRFTWHPEASLARCSITKHFIAQLKPKEAISSSSNVQKLLCDLPKCLLFLMNPRAKKNEWTLHLVPIIKSSNHEINRQSFCRIDHWWGWWSLVSVW